LVLGLAATFWHGETTPDASQRPIEPPAAPRGNPEQWAAEALALADRLASSFPDSPEALDLAARFQQRFGQPEVARDWWERCLRLDPRSAQACFCLGSAAWERGDFEKAVSWLEKALAIDPGLPNAPVVLGEALMQLGRPQEAVSVLEKAEAASPQSMRLFLLGQAHLQLKQHQMARENFEAAVALEPGYAKAHYGLIVVYNRLGDSKRAEQHRSEFLKRNAEENAQAGMERSVRRDPAADEIRQAAARLAFDAARLYAARSDPAESQRLLERAIALDPGNPAYGQARETLGASGTSQ
jgi:tetratricopeptide (TPR) repeat protein